PTHTNLDVGWTSAAHPPVFYRPWDGLQAAYILECKAKLVLLLQEVEEDDDAFLAVEAQEHALQVGEGTVFDAQVVAGADGGNVVVGAALCLVQGVDDVIRDGYW